MLSFRLGGKKRCEGRGDDGKGRDESEKLPRQNGKVETTDSEQLLDRRSPEGERGTTGGVPRQAQHVGSSGSKAQDRPRSARWSENPPGEARNPKEEKMLPAGPGRRNDEGYALEKGQKGRRIYMSSRPGGRRARMGVILVEKMPFQVGRENTTITYSCESWGEDPDKKPLFGGRGRVSVSAEKGKPGDLEPQKATNFTVRKHNIRLEKKKTRLTKSHAVTR